MAQDADKGPNYLSFKPITQLVDIWDWLEAIYELWGIPNWQEKRFTYPFIKGETKQQQIASVQELQKEWLTTRQFINRDGGIRRKNGALYENLDQLPIIRESIENAQRAGVDISLNELMAAYKDPGHHSVMDDNAAPFLFLDLFRHVLDNSFSFFQHYDAFQNITFATSYKPQHLHHLPFKALLTRNAADNYQAWLEWLYPFAPGEDYPFPEGQTPDEQATTIERLRDRVYYWGANDPEFKNANVQQWIQETWARLKKAGEDGSILSLAQIIGTYPKEPKEFGKTEATWDANNRTFKHLAESSIARRALLYKLFMEPPMLFSKKVKVTTALSVSVKEVIRLDKFEHFSISPSQEGHILRDGDDQQPRWMLELLVERYMAEWAGDNTVRLLIDRVDSILMETYGKSISIPNDRRQYIEGVLRQLRTVQPQYSAPLDYLNNLNQRIMADLASTVVFGGETNFNTNATALKAPDSQIQTETKSTCPFNLSRLTPLQKERFLFVWENQPTIKQIQNAFHLGRKAWHKFLKDGINPNLTDCQIEHDSTSLCYKVVQNTDE